MPPCAPSEQCIEKRGGATIRQMLDLLSRTVHAVFDKPATGRITSLETLMRVSYLKRHSKPHECHFSNLSRFRVCRYTCPSGGAFSSLIPEPRNRMATVNQNVLVVMLAVIGSLLFMFGINRFWPPEKRRLHNELIGWQLSILGTTYAVILGFMLYTVWTSLAEADLNADLEADSLVNVYRLADVLPEPQRTRLQSLARSYSETAVNKDWPEMAQNEVPTESQMINADMWKTVTSLQAASSSEITAQDHLLPNWVHSISTA